MAQLSQSQILKAIGFPVTPATAGQISGNGKLQQYLNQKAALKGLPEPFNPSLASTIIQDVLPLAATGAGALLPDTAAGGAAAGGGTAGAGDASKSILSASAHAIQSPLAMLMAIAWIFHPRSILRAVEFLTGIALIVFGLHAAFQARGERIEGFGTSEGALSRSGLGRVATELARATRGSGESGHRVQRPASAPHATRRRALRQRYTREEDLSRRKAVAPRPKRKPATA